MVTIIQTSHAHKIDWFSFLCSISLHCCLTIPGLCVSLESPQQVVCKDEETFTEQQLCNLDREDPEPPQSHEQKELCSPQEGDPPVLKQETDNFMLTAVDDKKEHGEVQTLDLHPYQNVEKHVFTISVISSVVSEPNSDPHQLSDSSDVAEVKDQEEDEHQGPRSTRNKKPKHSNSDNEHNILKARCNTYKGKKFRCDTCCKDFKYKSLFLRHMRSHTGEKPYPCGICGRMFGHMSTLKSHLRVHTGEKPYICISCGTKFRQSCHLLVHIKKYHGSEKLFSCQLCEKGFVNRSELRVHTRSHSAERPFSCVQCGRTFKRRSHVSVHVKRAHTCEKPFLCKICGKRFVVISDLSSHRKKYHESHE